MGPLACRVSMRPQVPSHIKKLANAAHPYNTNTGGTETGRSQELTSQPASPKNGEVLFTFTGQKAIRQKAVEEDISCPVHACFP